jgi:amino acid permease
LVGLLTGALACLKRFDLLLKISAYGTLSMVAYLTFILFNGVRNMTQNDSITPFKINYFTLEFESATGTFSLSFMIHNSIVSIYRKNQYQENNKRDLSYAYLLTTGTYIFVGVVGYLSVVGQNAVNPQTIMDFYP